MCALTTPQGGADSGVGCWWWTVGWGTGAEEEGVGAVEGGVPAIGGVWRGRGGQGGIPLVCLGSGEHAVYVMRVTYNGRRWTVVRL